VDKLKLLIIEDDVDQRELLRETLEDYFRGAQVVGASCMQEALAQQVDTFDLILCDYNLPDCSGMELLEEIRRRCQTPVIMVTGENVGNTAVEAIKRGATDYVVKLGEYLFTIPLIVEKNLTVAKVKRENEQLRMELERALSEVQLKAKQLEESLKRVEEMAATDPLTGLYNRRHFSRVLDQLFAEASRHDKELSCVMIDLDGYKQLNDSFGHQVGDQLLVTAGKVISTNLRKMDIAARYGGDEFVLLLPQAGPAESQTVAQRIREEYRSASAGILKRPLGVTMSIGIASLTIGRPFAADQLVAQADTALYVAKESGRDRIKSADPLTVRPVPSAMPIARPA
jgi:two-component system cell cycle response regulator